MKTTRIYLVGGSTEAHVVVDYVRRLSLAGYVITEDWASHVLHRNDDGPADEAADVANFALMISEVSAGLPVAEVSS